MNNTEWIETMNKPKKIADCHSDRSNAQRQGGSVKRSLAMVFPYHSELSHCHCEACNAGRGNLNPNIQYKISNLKSSRSALPKALLLMAVMIIPLASCTLYRPVIGETGHYYINPYADFSTVGKTVVFELDNLSTRPELSTNLTEAITEAIRKRHLFSLSTLYRAEPAWRKLDLNGSSSYSLEELSVIRQQSKADAVLFGRITQYHPYPHLLVALHLKLIDLRNGKLLWATEQVWDSTDKRVERRMRLYFNTRMRAGFQPLDWEILITSPRAFNNFVACEVAQTLPRANHYMKRRPASENFRRPAASATISKKTLQIPQKTLKFSPKLAKIGASVTL